jgi:hypothetical protein
MEYINDIAQYGLAGVAIAMFYRLLSNHLRHNTDAINKLAELIAAIKEAINKCTK